MTESMVVNFLLGIQWVIITHQVAGLYALIKHKQTSPITELAKWGWIPVVTIMIIIVTINGGWFQ
jgi:hypothetical protein